MAEQAEQQAQQAQRPRSLAPGEVKALVAAAWLMWDQLRELKADVAKARLSLLKGVARKHEMHLGPVCPSAAGQYSYG